jgi:hypothetical protein
VSEHLDDEMSIFGKDFISEYIQKATKEDRVPDEIFSTFGDIISIYAGDNDVMLEDLLHCISPKLYQSAPNQIVSFIKSFYEASVEHPDGKCMIRRLALEATRCMKSKESNALKSPLSAASVKAFLSICIRNRDEWTEIALSFIEHVIEEGSKETHRYTKATTQKGRGPISLCNAGVKDCCETFGWKMLEIVLVEAVEKMAKLGSFIDAFICARADWRCHG